MLAIFKLALLNFNMFRCRFACVQCGSRVLCYLDNILYRDIILTHYYFILFYSMCLFML